MSRMFGSAAMAHGVQLTWLFLGLVRAADFEAYGCWVADRNQYFFTPKTMQPGKLDANVVLVKLNGKDLYLDPGAEYTPFGLLKWYETGVPGLELDKDGGTWIQTTLPAASESRMERKANLKLSDTGDLEGKLTVTYTGLEAMYHRLDVRHADDVARKKFLEDRLKGQVPVGVEVELVNQPDWSGSETAAGRRVRCQNSRLGLECWQACAGACRSVHRGRKAYL